MNQTYISAIAAFVLLLQTWVHAVSADSHQSVADGDAASVWDGGAPSGYWMGGDGGHLAADTDSYIKRFYMTYGRPYSSYNMDKRILSVKDFLKGKIGSADYRQCSGFGDRCKVNGECCGKFTCNCRLLFSQHCKCN